MKKDILDRIQALGGDISSVKGESMAEDLCSITFNIILHAGFEYIYHFSDGNRR